MKRRVPLPIWESEMLCLRPARTHSVLPEFDAARHVIDHDPPHGVDQWVAGIDFGIRAPTAIVYGCTTQAGTLFILDERVRAGEVLSEHIDALKQGLARDARPPWPPVHFVAPDPAGEARDPHSGKSSVQLLNQHGLPTRISRTSIQQGLALVRARLAPATGEPPRLYIHERCEKLIESLERYRYDPNNPTSTTPVKGEFDHAIDALRYLITVLDKPSKTDTGNYAQSN